MAVQDEPKHPVVEPVNVDALALVALNPSARTAANPKSRNSFIEASSRQTMEILA
ncbi:hypothetical protein BF49_2468 [Bradyrhizobium sp.]|nr:hypothetical protein BF49_2468 [Bradyrhizobium sp.]